MVKYKLDPFSKNGISPDEPKIIKQSNGYVSAGKDGKDGANGADGADGTNGVGVVAGGTTGQALVKKSNTDYDTEWKSISGGTGTDDHAALTNLAYADSGHTGFQPAGTYLTEETDPVFTAWDKDHTDLINIGTNTHAEIDTKLASLLYDRETMKDPTGFTNNDAITVTYNSTTRKITLTGTFEAYYRGEKVTALVDGWESDAHPTTLNKLYFLYYNGTSFVFSDTPWGFDSLQIAYVQYNTNDKFAIGETHGFMDWHAHQEFHQTIGTYRTAGGTLTAGSYALNSTTAADRRPLIDAPTIYDEDLKHVITALTTETYTQKYLTGAGAARTFVTGANDIIPVTGATPYYNQYTGGAWQQTAMQNNEYAAVWLTVIPTSADAGSQAYRYIWTQPQSVGTLSQIQALTTNDLVIGDAALLASEFVFMAKVIIQMTGNNWQLISVTNLTGNRYNQTGSPAGTYLSTVAHDATLTGSGTSGDVLKVANPSTGTNTGDITVTDSTEIDFTLTGQQLTASIKNGSIDELKLDTSVNSSLDLADSAIQTELDPVFAASEAYHFASGDAAKLAGIEAGAEVNNISDVNATDLTDNGATTLHKHSYNNLDDKPTIPTQYTDEMAQDAVGNAVGNGLDYDDASGAISVDETELAHNSLGSKQGGTAGEYYHLTSAQSSALHAAVSVTDSTEIDFTLTGQDVTAALKNASVAYAKIQNVSSTDRILGRDSAGAGSIEEITPANVVTMLKSSLLDLFYPIGTIYHTTSTDLDTTTKMGTFFGGTWEAYGEGKVLVAKSADTEFDVIGETGGAKDVTLTSAQSGLPAHSHPTAWASGTGSAEPIKLMYTYATANYNASGTGIVKDNSAANASSAHTNLQPYIVTYRYRRTA